MDSLLDIWSFGSWQNLIVSSLVLSTITGFLGLISLRSVRQPASRSWVMLIALTASVGVPATHCCVHLAGWGVSVPVPALMANRQTGSPAMPLASTSDSDFSEADGTGAREIAVEETRSSEVVPEKQLSAQTSISGPVLAEVSNRSAGSPMSGNTFFYTIAIAWLIISLILFCRLLASMVAVWRLVRHAERCSDSEILEAVAVASTKIGLPASPQVLFSDRIATPMVLAFFRSTLLIPKKSELEGFEHLPTMLAHELAHIRRGDGWSRLWVQLIVALMPLQPLVWWMRSQFFASTEEACDDWAVASGSDPVDLAAVLTTWCQEAGDQRELLLAVGMSATRSRVLRLLAMDESPAARLSMPRRMCLTLVAFLISVSLAFAQPVGEPSPLAKQEPVQNQISGELETTDRTMLQEATPKHRSTNWLAGHDTAIKSAEKKYALATREFEDIRKLAQKGSESKQAYQRSKYSMQIAEMELFVAKKQRIRAALEAADESPAILKGQITLKESGKPAVGAKIALRNISDQKYDQSIVATTDNQGRYQIEDIAPGTCHIYLTFPGRPNVVVPQIELGSGIHQQNYTIGIGGVLKGRFVNAETELPIQLTGAEHMQISETSRGVNYAGCPHTDVESDGSFSLKVPAGRRYFGLYLGDFGSGTKDERKWTGVNTDRLHEEGVDIVEGQTTELEIRIKPKDNRPMKVLSEKETKALASQAAIAAIKALGGWVQLETIDGEEHVVEVNMVYHQDERLGRLENRLLCDECFEYARKFPHLKRLLLTGEQASDEGLAKLEGLENLEAVYMWDAAKVSDLGAAHLAKLKKLTKIHLSNSLVTDVTLKHFSELPDIEELSLQGNNFTDKGLEYIQDMEQLKSLWLGLGECEITDDGLKYLSNLSNLNHLGLQSSKITDAGLKHLQSLKNMNTLSVGGTGVTAEGLDALRRLLPKLEKNEN